MSNITSADISLSGYNSIREFISDTENALNSLPQEFSDISANVYLTFPNDEECDYNLRNIISINASSVEEAISELQKLKGEYTRVTLDVTLERSCNAPKVCHTCIYSSEPLQSCEIQDSNSM